MITVSAVVGIGGLGGARFPFCLLGCEKTKKQSSTRATQVTCDVAPTRSQGIRQSTVYADDDTFRRENQYIDTAAVTGSSVRTHSHAQLIRTCTRAHAQDMAVVTGSVSAQISRQPERNSHSPSYLAWNQSGKHHGEEAPSRLAALAVCLAVCLSVSVCLSVCLPVFFYVVVAVPEIAVFSMYPIRAQARNKSPHAHGVCGIACEFYHIACCGSALLYTPELEAPTNQAAAPVGW